MSGIAIYMEGGGTSRDSKAALRQGMDTFLTTIKAAARTKSWRWKLVCCGGRNEAFSAFSNARKTGEMAITVLLVDAEGPLNGSSRSHLTARDGWNLNDVSDDVVHLMVQTMEAWIVADPGALAAYYGQHFAKKALPQNQNLEEAAKADIAKALEQATHATQKGAYHKIRHASDLLRQMDPQKVWQRCPSCARLFDAMKRGIGSG